MSGTETTNTTPMPASQPGASRRGLLGGAVALLGGAGLAGTATAGTDDDAALIAASDRYVVAELEWRRLLYFGDEAAAEAFDDGERDDAMNEVLDLPPPRTPAGLRAKARAVVAFLDPDQPTDSVFDATLWEVLTTLAGPDVQATFQRQREALKALQS